MKKPLILPILLAVSLLCVFGSGDLQAQNKYRPAKVELQNCSWVRFDYLAPREAAEAQLHNGYTLGPPLPFIPEDKVAVLAQIIDCENFRIGEDWDVGGGAIYMEIQLPGGRGVISPEGEPLHWVYPFTVTNPLAREALQKTGINCHPAVDLWSGFDLDSDAGTVVGGVLMDNLKPFGPDLAASFEGPIEYLNTWDTNVTEYHAFGSKVKGVTWTVTGDPVDFYWVEGVPEIEYEGEFSIPMAEVGALPPYGGRVQIAFSSSITVAGAD